MRTLSLLGLAATMALTVGPVSAQTGNVLKSHNDGANTGQNLRETMLTPAGVHSDRFGSLFTIAVDPDVAPNAHFLLSGSQIYAQPLYVAGVSIPGNGRHNVLYVATEHDSVYAYDADSGRTLWKRTDFVDGTARTTIPGNSDLQPEIGITGTPAIDADTGTLYVVVRTLEGDPAVPASYHQRLHALDIATGAEKFTPGYPAEITASVTGTEGGPAAGPITFRPDLENQRCGLVVSRGKVYVAWASHRDQGPYHGWMLAYDARTGARKAVFNDSLSIRRYGAGIWQSAGSPSVDAAGSVYVTTGNGDFDPAAGDWGEAFLKMDPETLAITDYFCPFNHVALDAGDADIGTSALLLLPDAAGDAAHTHLMLTGGKVGVLYLLDRDALGKLDPVKNNVVQEIEVPPGGDGVNNKQWTGLYSVPAYYNGAVYYLRTGEYLKRVPISGAHLDETQTVANSSVRYGFPGATPSVSADGAAGGIVWAIESLYPDGLNMRDHANPGHLRLHAYDAGTLAELYNSGDTAPTVAGVAYNNFMKFVPPTVTNGHVYVAAGGAIQVYGMKSAALPVDVTRQVRVSRGRVNFDRATGQATQTVTLTNVGKASLAGPVSLGLDALTSGASLALGAGAGTTSYSQPSGTFYRNFPALAPGRSAQALLTFHLTLDTAGKRPGVSYQPRVLTGGDAR